MDDQSTLLEAALERGIPLYAKLCRFAKEECWMVDASLAANQLLIALEHFVLNLLHSSLDPSTVDIIFSQLMPWSRATEGSMRRAALSLLRLALATFVKEVEFEPGAPTRFSQGHLMVAKVPTLLKATIEYFLFMSLIFLQIVPRCTDPEISVRDLAVDCLGLVLDIISKYMGYSRDYEKPTIDRLEALKTDLGSADPLAPLTELATILNTKTPPSDLWVFLESMANGLSDPFPSSCSGLSLVMCLVLKVRGGEIHLRVKDLLDLLLLRLKSIEDVTTRGSILNGVCLLASHQRDTVVAALLSHSLPHNEDISDCWKALAADPTQGTTVLDHLTDILTYAAPYEERGTGPHSNESIVSWRLLSAVSGLRSMCQVPQLSQALQVTWMSVHLFEFDWCANVGHFLFTGSLCPAIFRLAADAGLRFGRFATYPFPFERRRSGLFRAGQSRSLPPEPLPNGSRRFQGFPYLRSSSSSCRATAGAPTLQQFRRFAHVLRPGGEYDGPLHCVQAILRADVHCRAGQCPQK